MVPRVLLFSEPAVPVMNLVCAHLSQNKTVISRTGDLSPDDIFTDVYLCRYVHIYTSQYILTHFFFGLLQIHARSHSYDRDTHIPISITAPIQLGTTE